MDQELPFDVFLSHSSKDKAVVRALAERLRKDGLRVWFDSWQIRPGDSIPAKIEAGLERSRVLVLCMSANAFGSDWAQLESGTFRFRDPLNKERRFVPLRLDDAPVKGSLAQYLYLNWHPKFRKQEYPKLLDACRAPVEPTVPGAEAAERAIQLSYRATTWGVAFSTDGKRILTGADDKTVRLWDLETGRCLLVLEGHTAEIWGVTWSADQRRALSGSDDHTARLWDLETGRCLHVLKGHRGYVKSLVFSRDQRRALSGAYDKTIRAWDLETGKCLQVLEGHTDCIWDFAWSADQRRVLSASEDSTVRLWDLETGRCLLVLEGHDGGAVRSVVGIEGGVVSGC
jgi:hypothetical protein